MSPVSALYMPAFVPKEKSQGGRGALSAILTFGHLGDYRSTSVSSEGNRTGSCRQAGSSGPKTCSRISPTRQYRATLASHKHSLRVYDPKVLDSERLKGMAAVSMHPVPEEDG